MSYQPQILIVDDEPQILRALRAILSAQQYRVMTANRGEEGLAAASNQPPDLILLDLALPDLDGFEFCRQLRQWTDLPVIVISVRDQEQDKVEALDSGADDYITKPFGIDELLARIRAAFRHKQTVKSCNSSRVAAGPIVVDLENYRVIRNKCELELTPTEFRLLAYLVQNAGRVLTYSMILSHVWGPQEKDHLEYLRVHIYRLRNKLEETPQQPKFILNESGIGYRFIAAD